MGNLRSLLNSWLPGWLQGTWGTRFFGVIGLFCDAIGQGASEALRAPWLKERHNTVNPGSPDDSLRLKGSEYSMPKYPGETDDQYRARLELVWQTWGIAGGGPSIIEQLEAAGYVGAYIEFRPGADGPQGQAGPWWSQFWVIFPIGSHPVTETSPKWNYFKWNDGTTWGPCTIPRDFAETVRGIISQFKPSDWICRGLVFQFSQPKWNDFQWNDGTRWNGAVEVNF